MTFYKKKYSVFVACLLLLMVIGCQRFAQPQSATSDSSTNSELRTTNSPEQDAWLPALISEYLQDNVPVVTTLSITTTVASVNEMAGTLGFTVTRTGSTSSALTVNVVSSDTSELAFAAGTVTIPVGTTTANGSLTVMNDGVVDGTQTVTLTASASGVSNATVNVNVTDAQVATTLSITTTAASVNETAGTLGFTVTRTGSTSSALTVNVVSSDTSELAFAAGTVTIPVGITTANGSLTVVNDGVVDGTQTVILTASASGVSNATVNVNVTDAPVVQTLMVTAKKMLVSEDSKMVFVTVSHNAPVGDNVVVTLSSSDSSEITVPANITIPAGSSEMTFVATILNDNIGDGSQNISISATASGFTGASDSITVTDTFVPVLAISFTAPSVTEGGNRSGTVSRTGSTSSPITVSLKSLDSTQLTLSTTSVTIPAGSSSASFIVSAIDEFHDDGNISAIVEASGSGYISGSAAITVTDNDTSADCSKIEMGFNSGHFSVVAPCTPTNETINVRLVPVGGTVYLLVEDTTGRSVQALGSGLLLGGTPGAENSAFIDVTQVNKLSINTNPTTGTNDTVQISSSLTLGQGLDIVTKYINVPPGVNINTSTSDIRMNAIERVVINGVSLTTSNGNISLFSNMNNQNTVSVSDDTCIGSVGSFQGINIANTTMTSSSGHISLSGCGGTSGNYNSGVSIANGSLVRATSGRIGIKGLGGQSVGTGNTGVYLLSSKVESNGIAPIKILGNGGTFGTKENFGIQLVAAAANSGGALGASGIYSSNGDISVEGNGGLNSTAESNVGVRLQGVSEIKSTGSADIMVVGTGGIGNCPTPNPDPKDNPCSHNGVDVIFDAQIYSAGTGQIRLEGRGGSGNGREHHGVLLDTVSSLGGATAKIASDVGDINIFGYGGDDLNKNFVGGSGLYLIHGASIEAQNSANITIYGKAGKGGSEANGIFTEGLEATSAKSKVSSVNGNIMLLGEGNNTIVGNKSTGVNILVGEVKTVGTGSIEIVGKGGSGLSVTHGIQLNAKSEVSTIGGSILLNGAAGAGSDVGNVGVNIVNNSNVLSNSGMVKIYGTGGSQGKNDNFGVSIQRTAPGYLTSKVQTATGAIKIVGVGGGIGTHDGNIGVMIGNNGGEVLSTSAGNINIDGFGGKGINSNLGVFVTTTAGKVSSVGTVTVKGTGSTSATGLFNLGVAVNTGGTVVQNGVNGTPVNSGTNNTDGVFTF